MLKAGVAISDITPLEPLYLAGYPEPLDRFGNTVHDPLYCSAFYLESSEKIMLICLDLCGMTKKSVREIREGIFRGTGIKPENIAVSSIHTHSGPTTTSDPYDIYNEDNLMYPDYVAYLTAKVIATGIEAYNGKFDATIGFESAICGKAQNIGGNRHNKDGICDDQIYALGIKDKTGALRGAITSYSLHPTLIHADTFAYSADFCGYMREYFSKEYPGCIFGFQMGTSGNQSPRHFRTGQTFEEAKRFGVTLGAAAKSAIDRAKYQNNAVLKVSTVWVDPVLKDFPSADKAALTAKNVHKEYDDAKAAGMEYGDLRSLECKLIGADIMAMLTDRFLKPGAFDAMMKAFPFEIQAVRIGELVILFVAGEHFVEIGLEIKKRSPFPNTYVATNTNGETVGYICTPKAHAEGGYEAQGTIMRPEMAQIVVDKALQAIDLVM